jgi:hypothetical protein
MDKVTMLVGRNSNSKFFQFIRLMGRLPEQLAMRASQAKTPFVKPLLAEVVIAEGTE